MFASKPLVASLAVLLFVTLSGVLSAQQDLEKMIAGKWEVSLPKTKAYYKEHSLATDNDDSFFETVSKISVEFGENNSVTVREGSNEQMSGQWKFVKEEDAIFSIDLIRDEEATRATLEFLDDKSVVITPDNERPLVLSMAGKTAVEGLAAELVGTWTCDRDATLALESNKKFDQANIDEMMGEAEHMVVTFEKDGTFKADTKNGEEEKELSGTWTTSNVDATKRTFEIAIDATDRKHNLDVELRSDGSVRFAPKDEPAAIFVRQVKK